MTLKSIFPKNNELVFIDNEEIFKRALKAYDYDHIFIDRFGGDFGHCTDFGNQILAEQISETLLEDTFH